MTTIKLLSAAAIAVAMLATPTMARVDHQARRHAAREAHAMVSPVERYDENHVIIPAPHVKAVQAAPDCDVGDNPFIC
jgi:hypothetical protein